MTRRARFGLQSASKRRRLLALATVGLGGLALLATVLALDEPRAPSRAPGVEDITTTITKGPDDSSSEPPSSAPRRRQPPRPAEPAPRDEATLMTMLRVLAANDPHLSLQLSREGDARFPASAGAAERGWFAVRALVDLGRLDEAVTEARVMASKYPNTTFANDVVRHLLTHPLSHPTEVGFVADR